MCICCTDWHFSHLRSSHMRNAAAACSDVCVWCLSCSTMISQTLQPWSQKTNHAVYLTHKEFVGMGSHLYIRFFLAHPHRCGLEKAARLRMLQTALSRHLEEDQKFVAFELVFYSLSCPFQARRQQIGAPLQPFTRPFTL